MGTHPKLFKPNEVCLYWECTAPNAKIQLQIFTLARYFHIERKPIWIWANADNTKYQISAIDDDISIELADWIMTIIPSKNRQYYFNRLYEP